MKKSIILIFIIFFSNIIIAKEITRHKDNEIATKLIPIINMLLLDNSITISTPVLITQLSSKVGMPNTTVEIKGMVGAKVYINGVQVAITDSDGKAKLPLNFKPGENIIRITLKDNAGNESKPLGINYCI